GPSPRPAYQSPGALSKSSVRSERTRPCRQTTAAPDQPVSQVVFSQLAAAVDSLCVVPGFGQLGGAVMSRMGIVITDFGSQTGKSYLGLFLLIPIIVSL